MPAQEGRAQVKVYLEGSDASIRVPVREIALADGTSHSVYDTSGPYTDPSVQIDLKKGLPKLRAPWIAARGRGDGNVRQKHFAGPGERTKKREVHSLFGRV